MIQVKDWKALEQVIPALRKEFKSNIQVIKLFPISLLEEMMKDLQKKTQAVSHEKQGKEDIKVLKDQLNEEKKKVEHLEHQLQQ